MHIFTITYTWIFLQNNLVIFKSNYIYIQLIQAREVDFRAHTKNLTLKLRCQPWLRLTLFKDDEDDARAIQIF